MNTLLTPLTGTLCFKATWPRARFSSNRVIAVKFFAGILGAANFEQMSALVFAGLPTTRTFTSGFEWAARALPWEANIFTLAANKSLRSIPSRRGMAPTKKAASRSLNATSSLVVATTECTRGKAQSVISRTTPLSTPSHIGISNRCRMTGWSGPKTSPLAMIGMRE